MLVISGRSCHWCRLLQYNVNCYPGLSIRERRFSLIATISKQKKHCSCKFASSQIIFRRVHTYCFCYIAWLWPTENAETCNSFINIVKVLCSMGENRTSVNFFFVYCSSCDRGINMASLINCLTVALWESRKQTSFTSQLKPTIWNSLRRMNTKLFWK